jgi:hypothetical protein
MHRHLLQLFDSSNVLALYRRGVARTHLNDGPRQPGAAARPSRSPQQTGFAWRACMGAQGA